MVEALECRKLLVDPGGTFGTAAELTLDGNGQATYDDQLPNLSDQDVYKFSVSSPDFITLLADAVNGGDNFDDRVDTRMHLFDYQFNHITSGTDSGQLTGGVPVDAWIGFVPSAAHRDPDTGMYTFYVRVNAQRAPLNGEPGNYTFRVDAASTEITLTGSTNEKNTSGSLARPLQDIVYRITTDDDDLFNSMMSANGRANSSTLDTRLDLYDSSGAHIVGDSQGGRLTNAFFVFLGERDTTYYVRMRSDEFAPTRPHTGAFQLSLDTVAKAVPLDPVTRIGYQPVAGDTIGGDGSNLYQFIPQSSGMAIIQLEGAGMLPVDDPSITLYDDEGNFLEFNDRFFGNSPQIETELEGGRTYYLLADGFDTPTEGTFHLMIEAGVTFVEGVSDDHADSLDFENATPIVWSDWQVAEENVFSLMSGANYKTANMELFDHPRVQVGGATGRMHRGSDTDLFVFTPPVDMLGEYTGNKEEIDEDMDGIVDRDLDAGQDFVPVPYIEDFRPATRVEIQVQAVEEPGLPDFTWADCLIRVYDSLGNEVYALNDTTFTPALYNPYPSDPAGALDPARWPADLDPAIGIDFFDSPELFEGVFSLEVWGGEAYYIEISSASGSGRYNMFVAVDGFTDPTDQDNWGDIASDIDGDEDFDDSWTGILDDTLELEDVGQIVSGFTEGTNNYSNSAQDFANAYRLDLGVADGGISAVSGVSNAYIDGSAFLERAYAKGHAAYPTTWTFPFSIADQIGASLLAGHDPTVPLDNDGVTILQESGLTGIEHPLDNDIYYFRAPSTGAVEVRISTTGLEDWFTEFIADGEGELVRNDHSDDPDLDLDEDDVRLDLDELVEPQTVTKTKTYNSLLHSAIRVFDNDFEEIVYQAGNNAIRGVRDITNAGSQGDRTFTSRDARVTIPVVQGQVYYIQVESGQRDAYIAHRADATKPVQWANVIGSYELILHTMPTLASDDFTNDTATDATVIPIDESTGVGSIGGEINNTVSNPFDADLFTFISPASGDFTVTGARVPGSSVLPELFIFRVNDVGAIEQIASGTSNSSGQISIDLTANKGERFFVQVFGAGNTEGDYTVSVSGLTVVDDHADFIDADQATEIDLLDFLGSAEGDGEIESNGDDDVFKFTTSNYAQATITVANTDGVFDPFIEVYETSVDSLGQTVLLRMAFNDNISTEEFTSQVVVGLTRERTSGQTGLTYPFYFLVVRSSDRQNGEGTYHIDIDFDQTDDHADLGQPVYATPIAVDAETGQGADTGTVEVVGDTDLFRFTALAGGTARITVSRPSDSDFVPKLSVIDEDGNELATPSDGVVPGIVQLTVTRGQVYYILVEASSIASGDERTGDYTLTVATPPLDDHPNADEWNIATVLTFNTSTGDAILGTLTDDHPTNPAINVVGDTDLFTFLTIAAGGMTVTVTPLDDSSIGLRTKLSVYDSEFNLVDTVTAGSAGDAVIINLGSVSKSVRYYVLVEDNLDNRTGEYQLVVNGQPGSGGGGGGGGGIGDIDFDNPTEIALDPINADGIVAGVIGQSGERDLYSFTAPSGGRIYVQLNTPPGSLLDGTITILDAATETAVVTFDATGFPGANAAVTFDSAGAGTLYYVIVDGVSTGTGSYTLRIDAEPEVYRVFFPEGFTSSTIREFVSLANPNDFDITYSVILRYETGERDQTIVSNATLAAGSRGGVTVSNAGLGSPVGARIAPYAIEVRAVGGPIGATLSHYDFGATLGEAFTSQISDTWNFARVERAPGAVSDFLVFYNPHDFSVVVTVTAHNGAGVSASVSTTVAALRRGGLNINQLPSFPTGVFGVVVTARAEDSGDDDAFQGIVSSLSHYNVASGSGFASLGDPDGGNLAGSLPNVTQGGGADAEIVIFNPNSFAAIVTLRGEYVTEDLPDLVRTLSIPANSSRSFSGSDLGLVDSQAIGLRYNANLPVTVQAVQTRFGDADSAGGSNLAATGWFFGDAFLNTALAGESYLETLAFYNPAGIATEITVTLLFRDGTTDSVTLDVGGRGFAELNLHELRGSDFDFNTDRPDTFDESEILGRAGLNFFSIIVSAATPVLTTFTHYDLFLQGGWTSAGAALGLTNDLSSIS